MPSNLKRYQTAGSHHFIPFSCYRRLPYLNNDHARAVFERELEKLRKRHQFYVFGYVLMPEHVYLLLSEPKRHILATTLNVLKAETSKLLQGDRRHVWQPRYHNFNVLTHRKHVEKLRYMHRNPVKRGLVENPEDWRWSTYCHDLTGAIGPDLDRVPLNAGPPGAFVTPPIRMKPRMDGAPGSSARMGTPLAIQKVSVRERPKGANARVVPWAYGLFTAAVP